ncbi:MAG TPA: M48 family metallopeptidase [Mycobacteriales bacterium]|nr:M48 family metallopeptidase [Mycobacteriales bacterium]
MNDPAVDPLPFELVSDAAPPPPEVEVRRSTKRRRTASAHREGDRIVVSVPARMTRAEVAEMVDDLVKRVLAKEAGSTPSDRELHERALRLSKSYLGGRAVPASVRWVDTMNSRWGSCTPLDRTIRLSRRLCRMPEYVVDYVLLHELAHLIVPGHGPAFWAELKGYERLERARGYLEGFDTATGWGATPTR